MKNYLMFLLLTPFLFSCQGNQPKSAQNFDWLIGSWIRTNDAEGKTTFEHWEKKSDTEYLGESYTMQENDTIWKENVGLVKVEEGWSFDVTQKGGTSPTKFPLTLIEKDQFICENQENEFPNKIGYQKKEDKLHAWISGNGTEIPFDFERSNK